MKKFISFFLINVYCLLIFKDMIPELIYQTNLDYIVKNLCEQKDEEENLCMGHCYLNKEIKKEAEENSKSTPASINTKNLESHFNAKKYSLFDYVNLSTDKKIFASFTVNILSNFIKPLLPPPK